LDRNSKNNKVGIPFTFSNEVEVDLDMLCMLVLNKVGGEVDGVDVVAVDENTVGQRSMELLEPTSFSHVVGHGAILSLDARSGDDVRALGGPGDEVVTEEHSVAQSGPACIWATCPVCIRVDHQLRGGGRVLQVEAEVQGASQIAQDVLHHGAVRL
jgi:hypothetical protein